MGVLTLLCSQMDTKTTKGTLDPVLIELKKIMEEEDLTYRALAKEVGVNHMQLFRWFKGATLSKTSRKIIKLYLISRL